MTHYEDGHICKYAVIFNKVNSTVKVFERLCKTNSCIAFACA